MLARGGNIFRGYLNDPERTAEALDAEGWLHTGDIGEFDEDGYLKIVDRKKELIITAGGKNISPANLEAALKAFPLIGQACVIGDGRPFVSALLVLDPEVAPAWATKHGHRDDRRSPSSREDPAVREEIERNVAEANERFSQRRADQEVRACSRDEWLPDSEELTPDDEAQAPRHPRQVRRRDRVDVLTAPPRRAFLRVILAPQERILVSRWV